MKSDTSLKSLVMAVVGAMVIVPATYAAPPDATLDKQKGKKQDQVRNELGHGSEQGQLSRENSRKWWIFEVEEPDVEQPPVDEDPDLPPEEPDPDLPPDILPPTDRYFF